MLHVNKSNKKRNTTKVSDHSVPPLSKPEAWFSYTDRDKNGVITQEEVIISICTHLRPTKSQHWAIRNKITDAWDDYDEKRSNKLTKKQFLSCGMASFLMNLEENWLLTYRNVKPAKGGSEEFQPREGKPSLSVDPLGWFEYCDTNKNGVLSKHELFHGLVETLKPKNSEEKEAIEDTVENCWKTFDVNEGGTIEKWEFLSDGGMADYLMKVRMAWKHGYRTAKALLNIHIKSKGRIHSVVPPPPLSADPAKWFRHFDVNYNNFLEKDELSNGLFVTFNAHSAEQRRFIRDHIDDIWNTFDKNDDNKISEEEFLSPDGLASNLRLFERDWKLLYDAVPQGEEGDKFVQIKVNIPEGTKSGSLIKVASPVSDEIIMCMIPEKVNWGGGEGESYFFTVKFSVDED